MTDSTRYRSGAIGHTGFGDYGHRLHLPYKALPNVEVVAIADPDDVGREKAIEESCAKRGYRDYREMLSKEKLDVVSICPRYTLKHEEYVLAAVEAGCHIYCEKPFSMDLLSADRMVDACEKNGVRMAVAHQSRYVEPFLTVKRMLEEQVIGRLLSIQGRGKEDQRGGGEDLIVLGTHTMDAMRYLAGDPEWVFGSITVGGREARIEDACEASEGIGPVLGDSVAAMFGFKDGVRGYFTSIRGQSVRGHRWGMTLVGTEGILTIRYGPPITLKISRSPVVPEEGGDFKLLDVPLEPITPGSLPLDSEDMITRGNRLAVWDLLQAAQSGRDPHSSGKDGRFALEMIHGVFASHLERMRLKFPLEDRKHPLLP